MGTKNHPGAFDCYANADPDEPMFVLLGRDRHAGGLVRLWALLRARAEEDPEKIAEALECAEYMDRWIAATKGLTVADTQDGLFQRLFELATQGLREHPPNFDHSCECDLCCSYATD